MNLLNKSTLAEALNHAPGYVSAMLRAGYRMRYGTSTDLHHALTWLESHPEFRSSHQYPRVSKKPPPEKNAPPRARLPRKKKPAADSIPAPTGATRARKKGGVAVTIRLDPEMADLLDGMWTNIGVRGDVLQRKGVVQWIIHMALGEYVRTGVFSGPGWMIEDFPPELIEARKAGVPYSPAPPSRDSGPMPRKSIPFPGKDWRVNA